MKSLLIIASFVALAVASPTHRGIEAGPAMLHFEPIAGGHSIVHINAISIARAVVRGEPVTISSNQNAENVRSANSLIPIIVNHEGTTSVNNAPISVYSASGAIVAEPEHIMEDAPDAVQVVEVATAPIGNPVLAKAVVKDLKNRSSRS